MRRRTRTGRGRGGRRRNESESGESASAGAQPSTDGFARRQRRDDTEEDGETDADGEMMPGASDDDPGRPGRPGQLPRGRADENAVYRAFTKESDEIVEADKLCDSDELGRLRPARPAMSHLQSVIARLANRLQRRLLASRRGPGNSTSKRASSTRRGCRASWPTRSCRSPTSGSRRWSSATPSCRC